MVFILSTDLPLPFANRSLSFADSALQLCDSALQF
jgi:hypothetical protein